VAASEALPMGPWDRKAISSAGRLANHVNQHASNFAVLALCGVGRHESTAKRMKLSKPKTCSYPRLLELVKLEY
jgi:hypothetical protein